MQPCESQITLAEVLMHMGLSSALCAGVYSCCHRFYLLFQHHTTPELSRSMNGLFGPPGTYSWCRQLGPRVALLGPDCRAERTVDRILSPQTYEALFARCMLLLRLASQLDLLSPCKLALLNIDSMSMQPITQKASRLGCSDQNPTRNLAMNGSHLCKLLFEFLSTVSCCAGLKRCRQL